MTFGENVHAILNSEKYDYFPVVSFGYWPETVKKWADEGHISQEEAEGYISRGGDNSEADKSIMKRLGFDFNWNSCIGTNNLLSPCFETEVLEERPDGSRVVRGGNGPLSLIKPGVVSIAGEVGTTLTDREAWENLYLPKLQWREDRVAKLPYAMSFSACWDAYVAELEEMGLSRLLEIEKIAYDKFCGK